MVVAQGQQYNVGEKSNVILYAYINRHAGISKAKAKYMMSLATAQFRYNGSRIGWVSALYAGGVLTVNWRGQNRSTNNLFMVTAKVLTGRG